MRIATVSIISILAGFPAFADARLPIVNVSAGSVSARAAFGEEIEMPQRIVEVAPLEKKSVVARSANKTSNVAAAKVSAGDVLKPKRPSNDLWAKNDKPLRMPEQSEFSVIRSDYDLPEESLDNKFASVSVQPAVVTRVAQSDISLDAELEKLMELQRRADASIRMAESRKPTTISSFDVKPSVVQRAATLPTFADVSVRNDFGVKNREEVSVSRVVVPMENDVVVRNVKNSDEPTVAAVSSDMSKMSPTELKKAFKKTYLSENKHLSTYQIDDRFDVASDSSSNIEGFTAVRDLSESGGVRPLEIKIGFRGDDSALSRDNYNLLNEYASIVVSNPKRAIQVSIPERATRSLDGRKLAARRLAIVEQVLRDTGVSEQRIMPVLSQRSDDSFVLRVISADQFETMTQQKRDMFGDSVSKKTYKSMSW